MLHAPKQTRSKKTLERILASARTLMSTSGVDAVGITQIVAHANSSVGSFYARFDGKEDMVRYLHGRLWEEANDRWETALRRWDPSSMAGERLGLLVEMIQDALAPDRHLRASITQVLAEDGRMAQESFDDRVIRDGLSRFAQDDSIRHPNPATCIPLGIHIVLSMIRDHAEAVPTSPRIGMVPQLTDELTRALRGYWGVGQVVQVEGTGSEEVMEYFDIWS